MQKLKQIGSFGVALKGRDWRLFQTDFLVRHIVHEMYLHYPFGNVSEKAWETAFDLLRKTFSRLPEAYQNVVLIFGYIVPTFDPTGSVLLFGNPDVPIDVVLLSRDVVLTLDLGIPFPIGYKYKNRFETDYKSFLEAYHIASDGQRIEELAVETGASEGIFWDPHGRPCKTDRLRDEIVNIMGDDPAPYPGAFKWIRSEFRGYTAEDLKRARDWELLSEEDKEFFD